MHEGVPEQRSERRSARFVPADLVVREECERQRGEHDRRATYEERNEPPAVAADDERAGETGEREGQKILDVDRRDRHDHETNSRSRVAATGKSGIEKQPHDAREQQREGVEANLEACEYDERVERRE